MKNYLYQFSGTILIKAKSHTKAAEPLNSVQLEDYIVDERLFETDEYYLSPNLKTLETQIGTFHHPINQSVDFERFKIREYAYKDLFRDFLNGIIKKDELIESINEIDEKNLDKSLCRLYAQIEMIELESQKAKTARLLSVD
jgi:hypothetical protein